MDVTEGRVSVSNPQGQVLVGAGQHAFVAALRVAPAIVLARDAIQVPAPRFDSVPPGSGLGGACVVQ